MKAESLLESLHTSLGCGPMALYVGPCQMWALLMHHTSLWLAGVL